MKLTQIVSAGLLAACAFAAPAFAMDPMMMKNGESMIVMPSGEMMMMDKTDKSMMEMGMKNAQPVSAGTIFMMNDGKLYMMQDMKMENGKMMSEGMMMKK